MYVRVRLEGLHGMSSLGSCLLYEKGGGGEKRERKKEGEESRRGGREEGKGWKEGKGGGGLGSEYVGTLEDSSELQLSQAPPPFHIHKLYYIDYTTVS